MEPSTSKVLEYLAWSPNQPCLHDELFRFSKQTASSKGKGKSRGKEPKKCRAGGVRAQLTPFALQRLLASLADSTASRHETSTRMLELIDIARCEKHRAGTPHLGPGHVADFEAAEVRLASLVRQCMEPLSDKTAAALHANAPPALLGALEESTFTASSRQAIVDGTPSPSVSDSVPQQQLQNRFSRVMQSGRLRPISLPEATTVPYNPATALSAQPEAPTQEESEQRPPPEHVQATCEFSLPIIGDENHLSPFFPDDVVDDGGDGDGGDDDDQDTHLNWAFDFNAAASSASFSSSPSTSSAFGPPPDRNGTPGAPNDA